MSTVAQVIAQKLAEAGVRYVFGHPGGEVAHLLEALRLTGIEFVLTRHEATAAYLAGTWGELTGRSGGVPLDARAGRQQSAERRRQRLPRARADDRDYRSASHRSRDSGDPPAARRGGDVRADYQGVDSGCRRYRGNRGRARLLSGYRRAPGTGAFGDSE